MKPHVRAATAAVAPAHVMGRSINGVHGHSEGRHKIINVAVSGAAVSGYDYTSNCHISGTLPNLCHHGVSSHLQLTPKGSGTYDGYDYDYDYDYDTSSYFSVKVAGNRADGYDYSESAYFAYSA
jgi:hypothetical protein